MIVEESSIVPGNPLAPSSSITIIVIEDPIKFEPLGKLPSPTLNLPPIIVAGYPTGVNLTAAIFPGSVQITKSLAYPSS